MTNLKNRIAVAELLLERFRELADEADMDERRHNQQGHEYDAGFAGGRRSAYLAAAVLLAKALER